MATRLISHLGEGGPAVVLYKYGQLGCSYWSEQHALVLNFPRHLEACWRQMWDNEYGYFLRGLQLYELTEGRI